MTHLTAAQEMRRHEAVLAAQPDPSCLPPPVADTLVLMAELEKAVAFETLKKTFGYKHQTYIEAETEIQQFESKLAEAARSALAGLKRDHNSAVEKEAAYSKASEQSRGQVAKREQVLVRIGELDSEITGLQSVLDEVTMKLRETEVSSGWETTIIRVKQKPMTLSVSNSSSDLVPIGVRLLLGASHPQPYSL